MQLRSTEGLRMVRGVVCLLLMRLICLMVPAWAYIECLHLSSSLAVMGMIGTMAVYVRLESVLALLETQRSGVV